MLKLISKSTNLILDIYARGSDCDEIINMSMIIFIIIPQLIGASI